MYLYYYLSILVTGGYPGLDTSSAERQSGLGWCSQLCNYIIVFFTFEWTASILMWSIWKYVIIYLNVLLILFMYVSDSWSMSSISMTDIILTSFWSFINWSQPLVTFLITSMYRGFLIRSLEGVAVMLPHLNNIQNNLNII